MKYVHFSKEDKAAATKARIELLCMARVLAKVVRSHCNGLPLQAEADPRAYKLLFMDVGLMNAVCGLGWTGIERMDRTRLVNEGAMAEQFIGQHLQALPCRFGQPRAQLLAARGPVRERGSGLCRSL